MRRVSARSPFLASLALTVPPLATTLQLRHFRSRRDLTVQLFCARPKNYSIFIPPPGGSKGL